MGMRTDMKARHDMESRAVKESPIKSIKCKTKT
jgi:hypothetical protein